ncbi:hypothetical protein CPC08DRAFT_653714 [Agrocybe pediades]|nr:hypothetical protein CPC08DRAFT_653714 [Agrocybe pediades]
MPPKQPHLGSLAVQGPSLNPQIIQISPNTCQDLSLFKGILKEYRKLDDTITMRLNRADAFMRDEDRIHGLSPNKTVQDQACEQIWRELVANWKRRTQLVNYCVGIVDQSLVEKRAAMEGLAQDPSSQRKVQAEIFANEVKRKHVHNELAVEAIVRKRVADAFRYRCQYFSAPQTDPEARKMWEEAAQR